MCFVFLDTVSRCMKLLYRINRPTWERKRLKNTRLKEPRQEAYSNALYVSGRRDRGSRRNFGRKITKSEGGHVANLCVSYCPLWAGGSRGGSKNHYEFQQDYAIPTLIRCCKPPFHFTPHTQRLLRQHQWTHPVHHLRARMAGQQPQTFATDLV